MLPSPEHVARNLEQHGQRRVTERERQQASQLHERLRQSVSGVGFAEPLRGAAQIALVDDRGDEGGWYGTPSKGRTPTRSPTCSAPAVRMPSGVRNGCSSVAVMVRPLDVVSAHTIEDTLRPNAPRSGASALRSASSIQQRDRQRGTLLDHVFDLESGVAERMHPSICQLLTKVKNDL